MQRLGNVLVAGSDPERLAVLVDSLNENGYAAQGCGTSARLLDEARQGRPDLVVLMTGGPALNPFAAIDEMRCDPMVALVPVVLVTAGDQHGGLLRHAIDLGVDDVLEEPLTEADYVYRLRPLLRLSTMRAELIGRMALTRRLGVEIDPPDLTVDNTLAKIMVVGGEDVAATVREALDGDCDLVDTLDIFIAEDILDGAFFDAALVTVSREHDLQVVLGFCSQVRNNPRLFNLPLVVTAAPAVFADPVEPYRRGATRLLEESPSKDTLRVVLRTLVARQRLRWRIRDAMAMTRVPATTDPLTGSYTFEFLHRRLEDLIASARAWEKPLSVLFFSTPNVPDVRRQFGDLAADHLIRQVCSWIIGLVRVEDVVARIDESTFCVTLPDTPADEARTVMNRVAGILGYTDFAVHEVYQPVNVWVMAGGAELGRGEDADSLLDRAREAMS